MTSACSARTFQPAAAGGGGGLGVRLGERLKGDPPGLARQIAGEGREQGFATSGEHRARPEAVPVAEAAQMPAAGPVHQRQRTTRLAVARQRQQRLLVRQAQVVQRAPPRQPIERRVLVLAAERLGPRRLRPGGIS
ncbi:hypothetical protein [Novosphingobium sp. Gsoil 351]|uniref:hypothetical protein n=1 Tax=Novosphingobium sp. Gsoil 351 TaxID=2675225 RepID=UPI0018A8633D|nr:hypothetical protein [Novosphingobium sp. Gsoil 351]